MHARPAHDIVVLIATKDRRELLFGRALPSVARQCLRPTRVVVVDDSDGYSLQGAGDTQVEGLPGIELLHNRRTPGAAGAWNSGIDHLTRAGSAPDRVFVAILDDDDEWEPDHLDKCYARVRGTDANFVATSFVRLEDESPARHVAAPQRLDRTELLVRNVGIQGSNMFVRLDVMLEAGMFDESLASCSDRDVCLRLAELPQLRYAAVADATVRHDASATRLRLSSRGAPARKAGLDAFWLKHKPLMSEVLQQRFSERARRYFDWQKPAARHLARRSNEATGVAGSVGLLVAFIADVQRVESVDALLGDLLGLRGEPGLVGLDVLVLENGAIRSPSENLARVIERRRSDGLRVRLITRPQHVADALAGHVLDGGASRGERLAIGPARTVLQSYAYAVAKTKPGVVVWVLDDDMRLAPLVDDGVVRERRRVGLIPQLLRLRETGAEVVVGSYTGAPPLPYSTTVRVQLVDLLGSLQWMKTLDPSGAQPDVRARNRALEMGRRDFYYDLSRVETDRLETAFLFEGRPGATVAEAFEDLSQRAERILAGEQISRPLSVPAHWSKADIDMTSAKRGGNTFVFDIEALREVPNAAPDVQGRSTRRSDMIWALLQRDICDRTVISAPVGTFHDRGRIAATELDVERTIDDIRGYAVYSALEGMLTACDDDALGERAAKLLEERLAAFRLSFHRCRGAAQAVRAVLDDGWMTEARFQGAKGRLVSFCEQLARCYTTAALRAIEDGARRLTKESVAGFRHELRDAMAIHSARLGRTSPLLAAGMQEERAKTARAIVTRLAEPGLPLQLLGAGAEGVVFTDGSHVFKVFDYWKARDSAQQRAFLRSLVGRFEGRKHLCAIDGFIEDGPDAVLTYPYEESVPYRGGHGPSLVGLLVECHAEGIVCRNLHPENLRVVGGNVRLIDYGSDIRPADNDPDGFEQMCRRAFLSWRFAHRADLKELMRRALHDRELPHLHGFERFLEAVKRCAGIGGVEQPLRARAIDLSAGSSVLDYGCGRGSLLRSLAPLCERCVGFDPDVTLHDRWRDLEHTGVRMTNSSAEALGLGPFDLVICERVVCVLEDDAAVTTLARDLRAAVKPGGRVLLSICHPSYAWRAPTPESTSSVPPDAAPSARFTWRKVMRASGRCRTDVHRPERMLRRLLGRAGLRVAGRSEAATVDLERFEYSADQLILELVPAPPAHDATLLLKACAMDAATLEAQVRHLVTQLDDDGQVFAERLLVLDSRTSEFPREHSRGDLAAFRSASMDLERYGFIDRVIDGGAAVAADVNQRWFGLSSGATHALNGGQVVSTLHGFDACRTRHVLQVDVDVMVHRAAGHDYLREMLDALAHDENAVTVAFNIAGDSGAPYTRVGRGAPWRTEVRCCLLDLERLRALAPLGNEVVGEQLRLGWHRALDERVRDGLATSLRGGAQATFFVHPQNARKASNGDDWGVVTTQMERGRVPALQRGNVDWVGGLEEWVRPERWEPFVAVVLGRDVPPGRFRRCVESLAAQDGAVWGAVVIDDASDPGISDEFERIAREVLGARLSFLRTQRRRGGLANLTLAATLCGDAESVLVTLDADDALIGRGALARVAREYERGADVTIGSMLRTDKAARYPIELDSPRAKRGGNVWQHLRTFKKKLLDEVPGDDLRLHGQYVDVAYDWAVMLPIVEFARQPVAIDEELYLHEPSGEGKAHLRHRREAVIAEIVAKPSRRRAG